MCGIAGIVLFPTPNNTPYQGSNSCSLDNIHRAVAALQLRGPDANGIFIHQRVALGHTRLAIIDTSDAAAQPISDPSGRYHLVFNGEIFNFGELRQQLLQQGIVVRSSGDTEVLLHCLVLWGEEALPKLNGFFALALYDSLEGTIFLARDRMGVKPLLCYVNDNCFLFASEMKALVAMQMPREIDHTAVSLYFQLNYLPPSSAIYKNVFKLQAGTYLRLRIADRHVEQHAFYQIPKPLAEKAFTPNRTVARTVPYQTTQKQLYNLMDSAVQLRLIADVPLGAFLSGGIDSSIITALAAQHTPHLNTFSVGYQDEPFFDETQYALAVAKKCRTEHTVFSLNNQDFFADLYQMLDYIDEPFADSSAIAVYILSKRTAKKVKVALSGDGADELFGGYRKHQAAYHAMHPRWWSKIAIWGLPLWQKLPQSRNGTLSDLVRRLSRFAKAAQLPQQERYWQWASLLNAQAANELLTHKVHENDFLKHKNQFTHILDENSNVNHWLYADTQLVLQGDMLTKVDMMSMANGLEVRSPFLDYRVVNFAFSLPEAYKINANTRKRIVQDTFRTLLPPQIYNRPKQGFEVPLLKWLKTELQHRINHELMNRDFIIQQNIFNYEKIKKIWEQLHSNNPADSAATIWAFVVFQHWWLKNGTIIDES